MQIGHYQLGEELGAGGMGTVYRGTDTRTDILVAIKQLKNEIATPETIERFRREGEALRELNHPNIVKMLDTFQHEGQHYLVMEFVSGGDLKGLIDNDDTLEIPQIVNMAIDLADALTRAHRLNIIHRDLKPANVLIGDDSVLRLTDFGVAHVGSKKRVTNTDAIVGTIDYLPPEAFEGSFDARGDIWAFGVMLFEMLAGERPFTGETIIETLQAITTKPIPDLEALCPSAPVALVDLVYRMLERDPQARISSVRYVGAILEDILLEHEPSLLPLDVDTSMLGHLHRVKHNLPQQVTPFVGRENELQELSKLLTDTQVRLVTILASGGMGKTRLSLEVAKRMLDYYEDGVYIVELASISDPNHIVLSIAEAADYQFQSDSRSPKQQVLDFLENKHLLLVMDNFENLIDGTSIVNDILQATSSVNILVTSRQRLSEPGETLYRLSGMHLPTSDNLESAMQSASVQLFMNSAKRIQPYFEITADNFQSLIEICLLVQGMPLGIILAASWLGTLSADEVLEELKAGIDFLATSETELPYRHRSIRAVMNYSWQMMTDVEQRVAMKMSVFRGGFTRQAAQTVAGANLQILMSLVNKTLILRNMQNGRYTIHELLRQYLEEKLTSSDVEDEIRDLHMTYFSEVMQSFATNLKGSRSQLQTLDTIDYEIENMRVAWNRALTSGNLATLDKAIECFYLFYTMRSEQHTRDVIFGSAYEKLIAQGFDETQPVVGRILIRYRSHIRQHPNVDRVIQALVDSAVARGDSQELAFCYYVWGAAQLRTDVKQAMMHFQNSIAYYEKIEQSYYLAVALNTVGYGYMLQGNMSLFIKFNEQSLAISKQSYDRLGEAFAYWQLGLANLLLGNYSKAEEYQHNAWQIRIEMRHRMGILWCKALLSYLGSFNNRVEEANQLAEESLALANDLNVAEGKAEAYLALALTQHILGNYERAHELCDLALANTRDMFKLTFTLPIILMSLKVTLKEYDSAQEIVLRLLKFTTPEMIMPRIMALPILATLLIRKGEYIRAIEILGLWYGHPVVAFKEHLTWQQLLADARDLVDEDVYHTAWERGKSLKLATVIQELMVKFRDNT